MQTDHQKREAEIDKLKETADQEHRQARNQIHQDHQAAINQIHQDCQEDLQQKLDSLKKEMTGQRFRQFTDHCQKYPHLKNLPLETIPDLPNLSHQEKINFLNDLVDLIKTYCDPDTQPPMSTKTLKNRLSKLESRLQPQVD